MDPVWMIRNEPDDDFGLARGAIESEGLPTVATDAWEGDGADWPSLDDVAAVVVFGGAMNCDQVERFPFLARERSMLTEAVERGLPVLGVCLGAQLLVRSFDQPVFEAPRKELGFPEIDVAPEAASDPVLGGLPPSPRFFQWHEDAFDEPPGAVVLARGRDGGVQAFRHGNAVGVQFHPEVTAPELERWFAATRPTLKRVWGRDPEDLERETAERIEEANRLGRDLFARFAVEVAAASDPV